MRADRTTAVDTSTVSIMDLCWMKRAEIAFVSCRGARIAAPSTWRARPHHEEADFLICSTAEAKEELIQRRRARRRGIAAPTRLTRPTVDAHGVDGARIVAYTCLFVFLIFVFLAFRRCVLDGAFDDDVRDEDDGI